MNTAEIIMQKKKIAAEKEKAEKQLAYDTIKQWVSKNVDEWAMELLRRVSRHFTEDIDEVVYGCSMGMTHYPLGDEYPEEIGCWWNVKYRRNGNTVARYGFDFDKQFFERNPIEKTKYAEERCQLFIGQLLFHTRLPELLKNEGFVVSHEGCGCCERISITLPQG